VALARPAGAGVAAAVCDRRDGGLAGLSIGGVVPFSTSDWPGRLAAVLFLQGCPWRCGYCHNPHLQPPARDGAVDGTTLSAWLDRRRGLLDAVVFSGGEPTAQRALDGAMREVADAGFAVGLHTGGAYPRRLAAVLPHVDWIGFDLKAPANGYRAVTGVAGSEHAAAESLRLVLASGIDVEIRTTVHPSLVDADALLRLADDLVALGVTRWVLQPFRPAGCADASLVSAAPQGARIDVSLLARLRERVPGVVVR